ncbi:MAG: hypothetical protein IT566_16340 [Rhodospirillaceae bacterium]|nr:hypothetical protein [Rhodospirillaceae bacterium]
MKAKTGVRTAMCWTGLVAAVAGYSQPVLADAPGLQNRSIAFAMTYRAWAVQQTPDKSECPNGLNDGPREQFKIQFPDDGVKRTEKETRLHREGDQWFPAAGPDGFVFHEAGGKISKGLNLDGRVDANDFTSPDGLRGVDNQLHRAIGCVANYRAPDGSFYMFELQDLRGLNFNRTLIELTEVDDLVNDDDVTLTTYRGLDSLLSDASGEIYPGGTQRIDGRFAKDFVQTFKAKIVDGVLTTEAKDLVLPWSGVFDTNSIQVLKGARFELRLNQKDAQGVIGAYVDIDAFRRHLNTTWSTHHQSYGQTSSPSLSRAMRRLADGFPDPKTGDMTGISAAIDVKFAQVFLIHPPKRVAQDDGRNAHEPKRSELSR